MQVLEDRDGAKRAQENALHDVLNIEREAQAIIAEAEARAERIVSEARARSREIQVRAEYEAQADANEEIRTSLRYAGQATRAVKKRAEDEVAAWESQARARLGATVEWMVRMVTMTEADGNAPRT